MIEAVVCWYVITLNNLLLNKSRLKKFVIEVLIGFINSFLIRANIIRVVN